MRLAICSAVLFVTLLILCPFGGIKAASVAPPRIKVGLPGEAGSAVPVTLTEGRGRIQDGLHPNAEGHGVIADVAWPELRRMAEAVIEEMEGKP